MRAYIEADKLKAEIRKLLIPTVLDRDYDEWEYGRDAGLIEAISIIESLQQEQPEVDLEKELRRSFQTIPGTSRLLFDDFEMIARHFYELCLNARKEE